MNNKSMYVTDDTFFVLSGSCIREMLLEGHWGIDSPIFDALAADRFASDRTVFNLGDYR